MKWVEKHAPGAIKEMDISQLLGRVIAIDASMQIYQFLVTVRHSGNQLTDADGNTTSHLQGILHRTVHFIQSGIRPVYVFDGKPPELKGAELERRKERRAEAEQQLKMAIEAGNEEDIDKFSRRTVRMDPEQVEECKKLLTLMGIPVVQAPCEAEAECAALCRANKAFATATEDMDALAHATPILIRHLTYNKGQTGTIIQIDYNQVLKESGITREEFVDFCILCGCDYCGTIKGIGPGSAFKLIQKHKCIEEILKNINKSKYQVPDDFDYENARRLFFEHEVETDFTFQWKKPNEAELKHFMVEEKGFNESRIDSVIRNLNKAKSGGQQTRMDSFFSALPSTPKKKVDNKKAPTKKTPVKGKKK